MKLCRRSFLIFLLIVRISVPNLIIIIQSETWNVNHVLGLHVRHETIYCAICLMLYEIGYFNMVVWILAGIGVVFFHSSGLDLATCARRQLILCVTKTSACHHTFHANQWHGLWEIPPVIVVKSNIPFVNKVRRFIVRIFYWGRMVLL